MPTSLLRVSGFASQLWLLTLTLCQSPSTGWLEPLGPQPFTLAWLITQSGGESQSTLLLLCSAAGGCRATLTTMVPCQSTSTCTTKLHGNPSSVHGSDPSREILLSTSPPTAGILTHHCCLCGVNPTPGYGKAHNQSTGICC